MGSILRIVQVGVLGVAVSSLRSTPLPLHTTMDPFEGERPRTATLVMPESLKNATPRKEVCAGTFDVPIGVELETG